MIKRLAFSGVLIVILLASGWSCMESGSVPRVELAILKKEMTKDATGAVSVNITVKNISRSVAELAEVSVSFYDAEKNLVGNDSDSVLNLNPDETWDFEFFCEGERCSEATSCDIRATAGTSSGRF